MPFYSSANCRSIRVLSSNQRQLMRVPKSGTLLVACATAAIVTEDQLQAVPGQSALGAVAGKIAGVRLVPNSAQPGGEPSLRLRGATSISGRQDPLIIVDGVITRFGLADVSGQDVERVEVV